MFGWTFVCFGPLIAGLHKVEARNTIENVIEGNRFPLSHLLEEQLLIPYTNQCEAIVLNGGFLTLGNEPGKNYTLNYPSIFVTCTNDSELGQYNSSLLRHFAAVLSSPTVEQDTYNLVGKDLFEDSILIIAFAMCAVCIGTWMVYLVLMLLPSESRLGRSLSVSFYVLFCAFYDTVMLAKTIETIFKDQYRDNVQDFCSYENRVISGTAFRVGAIIENVLLYLNWTMIIYYMFHDKSKITVGWLRPFFISRNKMIIVIGLLLTVGNTILYSLIIVYDKAAERIVLTILDFFIYTLFCGLTSFFVWHDFRFIFVPQRMHSSRGSQIKDILFFIWKDYHETIPLLLYNIALFGLLFFTKVYFAIDYSSDHKWKLKVVKFLQLIITVSVWGLIGVLEKRELILSKQTVLGRKINDHDEYFFDPRLSSHQRSTDEHNDEAISTNWRPNDEGIDGGSKHSQSGPSIRKPMKIWRSHMERPKNLKKLGRASGKRLLNALIGYNDVGTQTERNIEMSPVRRDPESQRLMTRSSAEDDTSDNVDSMLASVCDIRSNNEDEHASVETELARNYIYEYDNND